MLRSILEICFSWARHDFVTCFAADLGGSWAQGEQARSMQGARAAYKRDATQFDVEASYSALKRTDTLSLASAKSSVQVVSMGSQQGSWSIPADQTLQKHLEFGASRKAVVVVVVALFWREDRGEKKKKKLVFGFGEPFTTREP